MSKKKSNKSNKSKDKSVSELKKLFQKYFSKKGSLKNLYTISKLIYKKEPNEQNKENLISVYQLRIKDFLCKNLYEEALTLYDNLINNYLNSKIDKIDVSLYIKCLLQNNKFNKALNLFKGISVASEEYSEINSVFANHLIMNWTDVKHELDLDNQFYKEAEIIIYCINNVNNNLSQVKEQLSKIPIKSPFKEWKLFIKIYILWLQGNITRARRLLVKLRSNPLLEKSILFFEKIIVPQPDLSDTPEKFKRAATYYKKLINKIDINFINDFNRLKDAIEDENLIEIINISIKIFNKLNSIEDKDILIKFIMMSFLELEQEYEQEYDEKAGFLLKKIQKCINSYKNGYYFEILFFNLIINDCDIETITETDILEELLYKYFVAEGEELDRNLIKSLLIYFSTKNLYENADMFVPPDMLLENNDEIYVDMLLDCYNLLKNNYELYPKNPKIYNLMIEIAEELEESILIHRAAEIAYNQFPDNLDFILYYAKIIQKDNLKSAVDLAEKAYRLAPLNHEVNETFFDYKYRLAQQHIRKKDYCQAKKYINNLEKFDKQYWNGKDIELRNAFLDYKLNCNDKKLEHFINEKFVNRNFKELVKIQLRIECDYLNIKFKKYHKNYSSKTNKKISIDELIEIIKTQENYMKNNEIRDLNLNNNIEYLINYNIKLNKYTIKDYCRLMQDIIVNSSGIEYFYNLCQLIIKYARKYCGKDYRLRSYEIITSKSTILEKIEKGFQKFKSEIEDLKNLAEKNNEDFLNNNLNMVYELIKRYEEFSMEQETTEISKIEPVSDDELPDEIKDTRKKTKKKKKKKKKKKITQDQPSFFDEGLL